MGNQIEETLHKRRDTNSQQIHDKMFNIISNQGDANQNYTEIPSNPNQNGNHKSITITGSKDVGKQELFCTVVGNAN